MGWRTRVTALVGTLVLVAAITTGTAQADGQGHGHERDHRDRHVGRQAGIRKLDHIVVLMQENRSFDSYFGHLHDQGQPRTAEEPDRGNPDPTNPNGPRILPFHATQLCTVTDLNHEWTGTHLEFDGGRMDGFTAQNVDPKDPTGSRTMGYFDGSDLPFYYSLASTFGLGDRSFASVLGPTYPNRFYEMTGTSFGHIRNDLPPAGGYTQPTIFGRLQAAGITWKVYYAIVPAAALFSDVQAHADHLAPLAQYYADAKAGTLPQVAFIEPRYIGDITQEADEHPPSNPQVGQQFTSTVVNALMTSPNWASSAFILTYDEHGGYYDHVVPPRAPKPDDIAPMLKPGDTPVGFDRYGIRVPFVMVSPYSKPHFVSHDVQDHTSILKFIETRFGLKPLTQRDAHADNLLDYFDFAHPHFLTPPAQCAAAHPGILGL